MSHYAIVKWAEFQHYKDRSPPWIKLHRSLLTSETWVSASTNGKVLAVACMMLAADTGNKIPASPRYMQRAAYLDFIPDFSELVALGFLTPIDVVEEIQPPLAGASTLQADARPEERREEREEEKKEEHPSPPSVVRSPQKSRGEFLPQDWKPCIEGQRMATAAMGGRDAALEQLEQFRDYWFAKSGADGRKRDWDAAWRNWIRKAVEYGKRNGPRTRQQKPPTGHAALIAATRSRLGPSPDGGGGEAGISHGLDAQRDGSGVYRLADRGH